MCYKVGLVDWLHFWKFVGGQASAQDSWTACSIYGGLVLGPSFVLWVLDVKNLLCLKDQGVLGPLVITLQVGGASQSTW